MQRNCSFAFFHNVVIRLQKSTGTNGVGLDGKDRLSRGNEIVLRSMPTKVYRHFLVGLF
jgi:hypothetical protein